MQREVIINEEQDSLPEEYKRRHFEKFLGEFKQLRHQHFMCHHCGRTFDSIKDNLVGNVEPKEVEQWRLDQ
jgi:hypothetical protein